jgi:integrase
MRKKLTDKFLKALKPTSDNAAPLDIMDSEAPGLGVRVMGTRKDPVITFVLRQRFPGSTNPTRARLGGYGELTLEQARDKARDWRGMTRKGRDPRLEEKRQRDAELAKLAARFGKVAEAFIKGDVKEIEGVKIKGKLRAEIPDGADKTGAVLIDDKHWRYLERQGADVEREIRKELAAWWDRPIADITRKDITTIIRAKAQTAPSQARNLLGHCKRVFQWTVDQDDYGLVTSPAKDIKPTDLVGEKIKRERALADDEVRAFWRAAERMPYPAGLAYRLLLLTGLRLSNVEQAHWKEFNPVVRAALRERADQPIDWSRFDQRQLTWTVPADKMKGKNGKSKAYLVPLTLDALHLLESLPQFVGDGGYLFSHTGGRKPAVMSSTGLKNALDVGMLRTLRAMARQRGDDHRAVELASWVNHDLRRTVRSNLSKLEIAEEIREAVLQHVRPGIKGTYDVHDYHREKRDALTKWCNHLRTIVEPTPPLESNVVALRG